MESVKQTVNNDCKIKKKQIIIVWNLHVKRGRIDLSLITICFKQNQQ